MVVEVLSFRLRLTRALITSGWNTLRCVLIIKCCYWGQRTVSSFARVGQLTSSSHVSRSVLHPLVIKALV